MALSQKQLQNMKGTDGETLYVADKVIPGLGVRYGSRGRPSFTLAYRLNGVQRRQGLGLFWKGEGDPPPGFLTLAQARAKAASIKDDASRGIDTAPERPRPNRAHRASPSIPPKPVKSPTDPLTVTNVLVRYGREYLSQRRTGRAIERHLEKHLLPAIGKKRVGEVKPDDIRPILNGIMADGHGFNANLVRSLARAFFVWCEDQGLVESSPLAKIRRPMKKVPSRDRVLSDEELSTLWDAVTGWDAARRDVFRVTMILGCRIGEACKMKWADLDLDKGEWHIPAADAKNEVARTVFLSDFAIGIIKGCDRVAGCPFVFTFKGTKPIGSLSTFMWNLKHARPELGDVRIHDFRRSFASGLQRMKHQPAVIDRCLGHSAVIKGVAAVYARFSYEDERRAAFAAWSSHVETIVTKGV